MSGTSFYSVDWANSTSQIKVAVLYVKDVAYKLQLTEWQMPAPDIDVVNEPPNGWPYMSTDQQITFVLTHGEYQRSQQSRIDRGLLVGDVVDFVFDIPALSILFIIKVGTLQLNRKTMAEVITTPYSSTTTANTTPTHLH